MNNALDRDEHWMQQALDLARRGVGLTRPNPPVGALVVKNSRIVGEGYHRKAGGPHAEIYALRSAGRAARGATLYVTLEPCSTWGRTPPCTEAIVEAGIRRVVAAMTDPNPRHSGKGFRWLRAHNVEVRSGICRSEAFRLIEPFTKWVTTGMPWVTLKLGLTFDGRIADARGRSQWITGVDARNWVHRLRRTADAILVGAGTVMYDNPGLTPRPSLGRKPYRVIVDSANAVAPLKADVFNDESREQTILAVPRTYPAARRLLLEKRGVHILEVKNQGSRVDLRQLIKALGKQGILHVLCEGGGKLAAALVNADLVDECVFFYAPLLLGADGAKAALAGRSWLLEHAPRLQVVRVERVGPDVLIIARPLRA